MLAPDSLVAQTYVQIWEPPLSEGPFPAASRLA